MQDRPTPGNIIKAYCDCAKTETTWIIIRRVSRSDGTQHHLYSVPLQVTFYFQCLSCGKERKIGDWPAQGNEGM